MPFIIYTTLHNYTIMQCENLYTTILSRLLTLVATYKFDINEWVIKRK